MCKILDDNYYNVEKYLIQTRSQAKSSGIILPEVHGVGKNLDPHIKPEKQHAICKQGDMEILNKRIKYLQNILLILNPRR